MVAPPMATPQVRRAPVLRMEEEAEVDFKGAESWSADMAHPEPVFDILKVKEVLPHRYPFLLGAPYLWALNSWHSSVPAVWLLPLPPQPNKSSS